MARDSGQPGEAGSGDARKPPRPVPLPPPAAAPGLPPAAVPGLPPSSTGPAPAPRPRPVPAPQPILPPSAAPSSPARPQPIPAPKPTPAQPAASTPPSPAARPKTDLPLPAAPRPLPAAPGPRPIPLADAPAALIRSGPIEEATPEERLKRWAFEVSPAMLISACVHLLVLVILGVWIFHTPKKENIELQASYAEEIGEQLDDERFRLHVDPEKVVETDLDTPLPTVDDALAPITEMEVAPIGDLAFSAIPVPTVGISVSGREAGVKRALLSTFGGDAKTEEAVQHGLEWLAHQQQKDGSWSMLGPYSDPSVVEDENAATAMALLAFQGAGHTHRDGQFKSEVARGITYLLKQQKADGDFFNDRVKRDHWMYCHAQCTMAVCDLYAMTQDQKLREPAEKAIEFCVFAQEKVKGGWRYSPDSDSDTSVTGWMMMALQTAQFGKLKVPEETLEGISRYLDRATTDKGSSYAYLADDTRPTFAMTAEGLLCRQYLGWDRDDQRLLEGAAMIAAEPPKLEERDVYYWYYGTQMLHHMEGQMWQDWNRAMRIAVLETQNKTMTKERGSWDPLGKYPDVWAKRGEGGRLYTTCLSLFMLEVYYRHLPIYSELKKRLEAAGG